MPSFRHVILCSLWELIVAICVGLPLTRRLVSQRELALALAPAVGWAVFNALALPILTAVGFARPTVALLSVGSVVGATAVLLAQRGRPAAATVCGASGWGYGAAALFAVAPALAVWPKYRGGGVVLSEAMFDHSKAAIIDDIVRLGLPPGNPFFAGGAPRLSYYYLWHFSAALPAASFGASGWEADIGLTWFTAFSSLALMMGLAALLSGRKIAPLLVVPLCLAASMMPLLRLVFSADFLEGVVSANSWPQSWIFQASWAPQHLAAANCTVVAVLLMSQLAAPRCWFSAPLLAIVAAAGFQSSAWVGGVVFAAAAVPIAVALLLSAENAEARLALLCRMAIAAVLAAIISFPFLRDEYLATAARRAGAAIAFRPIRVLGTLVPGEIGHLLDLPAYWLVLLAIQYPAIYFAGAWATIGALAKRGVALAQRQLVVGLALLAGASLVISWLFASTIANNDLGWRGVLPGILVLTIFSAAGLSRWLENAPTLVGSTLVLWALGIPGGVQVVKENFLGLQTPSAVILAETPELWRAVRNHTAPDERIANNPRFLGDSVRWPVNISWALLSNRRSCYAGWNLARAFAPLPEPEIDRIDALFKRVFAGDGRPQDLRDLATRFDCRAVVITPSDGAWRRDPFAGSPLFRLAEEKPGRWRIYRVVEGAREPD